eukprot:365137-Chlamydomonas_euryale.AAC.12
MGRKDTLSAQWCSIQRFTNDKKGREAGNMRIPRGADPHTKVHVNQAHADNIHHKNRGAGC